MAKRGREGQEQNPKERTQGSAPRNHLSRRSTRRWDRRQISQGDSSTSKSSSFELIPTKEGRRRGTSFRPPAISCAARRRSLPFEISNRFAALPCGNVAAGGLFSTSSDYSDDDADDSAVDGDDGDDVIRDDEDNGDDVDDVVDDDVEEEKSSSNRPEEEGHSSTASEDQNERGGEKDKRNQPAPAIQIASADLSVSYSSTVTGSGQVVSSSTTSSNP